LSAGRKGRRKENTLRRGLLLVFVTALVLGPGWAKLHTAGAAAQNRAGLRARSFAPAFDVGLVTESRLTFMAQERRSRDRGAHIPTPAALMHVASVACACGLTASILFPSRRRRASQSTHVVRGRAPPVLQPT
jgi:hypothetical protein